MKEIRTVRGVNDLLPEDMDKHLKIIEVGSKTCKLFCYEEIDIPVFEYADLFVKPLGETSDIVTKENYIFKDRSDNLLMLRPEGTTSVVRAVINAGFTQNLPQRFFYSGSMFRYERPQKGRLRQFNQLGAELIGVDNFYGDVEVINIAYNFLKNLNLMKNVTLYVNSLGDEKSRKKFRSELVLYLEKYESDLSSDSKIRLKKNPLRILDSKNKNDQILLKNAPKYLDYLNEDSKLYFENVCECLKKLGIPFEIDEKLVRGLDYYSHTTFEFKTDLLGAQDTILAGGRYDGLSKMISDFRLPGVGWAAGLERLALMINSEYDSSPEVTLIAQSNELNSKILNYHQMLIDKGIKTEMIYSGNLNKKLKRANKTSSKFAIIIGENELENDIVQLKNLHNGLQSSLKFKNVFREIMK
ncbi:MAG: histidine--tRNA ligase [Porticoccaceae bacterium]|nr:histidine--tRNA ligase [Porticoccaceae bacterium]